MPQAQQSSIRARLRRIGFYVSDWSEPGHRFTAGDFDRLVEEDFIQLTPLA